MVVQTHSLKKSTIFVYLTMNITTGNISLFAFYKFTEFELKRYHSFAAEEFVIQSGGMLCPQPRCGMGILGMLTC